MEKLSVIVTAWNAGDCIGRSLESILGCSWRNLEIVVVNDASEDDTGTVVESLRKMDRRIKCVNLSEHVGRYHARMTGAAHSDGDYLAFLDADAWVSCDFYRRTLQKAAGTGADLVMGELLLDCGERRYRYCNHWQCRIADMDASGEAIGRQFLEACGQDVSLEALCHKVIRRTLWDRCCTFLHMQENLMERQADKVFSLLLCSQAGHIVNIHEDFVCCPAERMREYDRMDEEARCAFRFLGRLFQKEVDAPWAVEGLEEWEKNPPESGSAEVLLFTEVSGLPYEAIKRRILSSSVEVVSFDVFDTLLVRPFFAPTDLFDFLDFYVRDLLGLPDRIGFKQRRIEAESMARERLCGNDSEDVTLLDIYGVLEELVPLSSEQLELVMRREIALELKYCRPRQAAKALFDLALHAGKMVVAASDMYLPLPVIRELLSANGYDGIGQVFLSNDRKRTKGTGNLYALMAEELGVETERIFHIGDNLEADVHQAQRCGLQAAHFPRCADLLMNGVEGVYSGEAFHCIYQKTFGMRRARDFQRFLGMRLLLGMVANRLFDNPFPQFHPDSDFNADPRVIGYGVLGPHLFAIADWLVQETKRHGYQNLNFMARDGYLPMKAFEILQAETPLPVELHYLYFTRSSILPLQADTGEGCYGLLNFFAHVGRQSPESVLSRLEDFIADAVFHRAKEICEANGIPYAEHFHSVADYYAFVELFHREFYDSSVFAEYTSQIGQALEPWFSGRSATFDVGYNCRIESVLRQKYGFDITSYYINIDSDIPLERARKGKFSCQTFYSFSPGISGLFRELLISELAPSCVGIGLVNGKMEPVFEEYRKDYSRDLLVGILQKQALDFVRDVVGMFGDELEHLHYQREDISLPHEYFMCMAKARDRRVVEGITGEDSMGLGEKLNLLDFWEELTHSMDQERMETVLSEARMKELGERLSAMEAKYDALYRLVFKALPSGELAASLRKEADYAAWFRMLKYVAQKYLVILTVKDTAGSRMPQEVRKDISDAGFTLFRTDLWRTYVGVVSRGKVVAQEFHENEVQSDYFYESLDGSFRVEATSQSFRRGNCGDIRIDGENYAVNLRGVNIVIYDGSTKRVVDSIGFDSHDEGVILFQHLVEDK